MILYADHMQKFISFTWISIGGPKSPRGSLSLSHTHTPHKYKEIITIQSSSPWAEPSQLSIQQDKVQCPTWSTYLVSKGE